VGLGVGRCQKSFWSIIDSIQVMSELRLSTEGGRKIKWGLLAERREKNREWPIMKWQVGEIWLGSGCTGCVRYDKDDNDKRTKEREISQGSTGAREGARSSRGRKKFFERVALVDYA
jgi:hypothetical protein